MNWFKNMNWFKKQSQISETPVSNRCDEWNQKFHYDPMDVVRLEDGELDPPLDQTWDDATRLRWHAGVLKADTGFSVAFYQPASGREDKVDWTAFGVVAPEGASALASVRANEFWLFSVGVGWGIRWARNQADNNDE